MPISVTDSRTLHRRALEIWRTGRFSQCERLEILCAMVSKKPLVRLVAEDDTLDDMLAVADLAGLHVQRSRVRQRQVRAVNGDVYTRTVPWEDRNGRWFSVFLANDDGLVRHAVELEFAGANFRTMGQALAYPACCVESYDGIQRGTDWLESTLDGCRSNVRGHIMSNPLARLFSGITLLPDFFPCSLDCRHARSLGYSARDAIVLCGLGDELEAIIVELTKPIVRVGRRTVIQLTAFKRTTRGIEFDSRNLSFIGTVCESQMPTLSAGGLAVDRHNRVESFGHRDAFLIEFNE